LLEASSLLVLPLVAQRPSLWPAPDSASLRSHLRDFPTPYCRRRPLAPVIDVKGRFLSGLSKAAIFAMTFCPLDHLPAQDRRNGQRSVALSVHPFRPHPEQREQFRQIDQAFGLMSLGVS
jgi:hypothetical protein